MLYFIIFREEGVWVAHGLQRNVVAQGSTLERVRENLRLTLRAYREMGPGCIEKLPMADSKYWEMFVAAIEAGRLFDGSDQDESADAVALKIAA